MSKVQHYRKDHLRKINKELTDIFKTLEPLFFYEKVPYSIPFGSHCNTMYFKTKDDLIPRTFLWNNNVRIIVFKEEKK